PVKMVSSEKEQDERMQDDAYQTDKENQRVDPMTLTDIDSPSSSTGEFDSTSESEYLEQILEVFEDEQEEAIKIIARRLQRQWLPYGAGDQENKDEDENVTSDGANTRLVETLFNTPEALEDSRLGVIQSIE
ncbi:hypothetical protein ACHAQJ_009734, partial [Trichoderma viride]